jgi:hypothetical protein
MRNISKQRRANFWYFKQNHIPSYKKKVKDYLSNLEDTLEKEFPRLFIDLYDMDKRENKEPTGHLFAVELPDELKQLGSLYDFILSKDRMIKPIEVSCNKKEDYALIEQILKENYGNEGKLKNYFWIVGRK